MFVPLPPLEIISDVRKLTLDQWVCEEASEANCHVCLEYLGGDQIDRCDLCFVRMHFCCGCACAVTELALSGIEELNALSIPGAAFCIDSGATSHFCYRERRFDDRLCDVPRKSIVMANGDVGHSKKAGTVVSERR